MKKIEFNCQIYLVCCCTSPELLAYRAEMVTQMEVYLGSKEKCRRLQLLKHFDPGATGTTLGISRVRGCCDCCTMHLFRYQVHKVVFHTQAFILNLSPS